MNLSKKFKPSRSVLDIGPAVGIDNEPYDPRSRSQEDFKTGTGLILGPSKHDSSKGPRVTVSKWGNRQVLCLDHPDLTVASELLMKALGMGDRDFFKGMLKQLADRGLDRTVDEDELNFMLSVIKGIEPKNTIEHMLVAQMARVHVAAMSEQESAALAKLTKTFAMQLETLNPSVGRLPKCSRSKARAACSCSGLESALTTLRTSAASSWRTLTSSRVIPCCLAEHREPCESRGSRTVLGAPGGEIPPGDSTALPKRQRKETGR
jgi:hypothetical protein